MSCTDGTCGTGGWTGPQPGDPDNNITLSARTVFGGVQVSWSYPLVNGHAVAYTEIFRGASNNPVASVLLDKAGGSSYLDRVDPVNPTEYYYWVQVVSIHGTRGARIGPVLATAKPQVKQTLESLTGLIDASYLAETLKTDIAGITLNNQAIYKEIQDRLAGNLVLQNALTAVQGEIGEALTFILNETTARSNADSAIVLQVNAISTGLAANTAAITEERTVRVTKDDAMAQQISTLFTESGANTAAILIEKTARTTADTAMASDITTLFTSVNNNAAAITSEQTVRSNADSSLARDITTLASNTNTNIAAAVQVETTARTSAVDAVANRVTTVESSVNGNVATGQVGLKTEVDTVKGKVNSIWYAKVQVNNLIGGFGINNDGTIVDAGFDVDRFWIGRTGPDKVKPFIVDGGIVYIDKARIRSADIDTLKIAGNSVMTGVYDSAGSASVLAGGTTDLITRTLDLGDGNNSGVIVSATVSVNGGSNATVGFKVLINGQVAGDHRASIVGGFGYLFPAAGFAPANGSRYATITLQAYNPTFGGGANVPFNVTGSTIAIMGGKR